MTKKNHQTRKDLIAETIILVLAHQGARGLTHREIDRTIKLPEGTTSNYFRRRIDLLNAGYKKLTELNLRDMMEGLHKTIPDFEHQETLDLQLVAQHHYRIWLLFTKNHPYRLTAHIEFFLLASHDEEVRLMIEDHLVKLYDFSTDLFRRLGAKNPYLAGRRYGNLMYTESWSYILIPPFFRDHEISAEYFEKKFLAIINETDSEPNEHHLKLSPKLINWKDMNKYTQAS